MRLVEMSSFLLHPEINETSYKTNLNSSLDQERNHSLLKNFGGRKGRIRLNRGQELKEV